VFDHWNAWEVVHIGRDEFLSMLDEAWFNWKEIPGVEIDLASKVSRLTKFGTIDVVTARSEATVPFAQEWLEFQRIPYARFVRTVSTSAKAGLDYDVFIDDSDFLMSLIASRLFGFGILYTQPWNRSAKRMPRTFRVNDWGEIPRLIEQIQC
jgi:5'(3')-deoxyribonucleotidase